MPDIQLIGFLLLLTVVVIAAYFYLKRAQRRAGKVATTDLTASESKTPPDQQS